MASYKVIQDIEAEDTLIGPLTLKQCIYAGIAVVSAYLSAVVVAKGAPFLLAFTVPLIAAGAFFAFPWSKQQSTEIWALAKIRFYFKPRRRIWDQSGLIELVTITAPKRIEIDRTKGLSQTEVKSRLKALAETIDTRGWAVKNVGINIYGQPDIDPFGGSDRLLSADNMPREVPSFDPSTVVDMLDVRTNPRAERLEKMIDASSTAHRQKIVQQLNGGSAPTAVQQTVAAQPVPAGQTQAQATNDDDSGEASYWYLSRPLPVGARTTPGAQDVSLAPPVPVAAQPSAEDVEFLKQLEHRKEQADSANARLRTLPNSTDQNPAIQNQMPPTVTEQAHSATLGLASNNDLSVATIQREARRINGEETDEVVVNLH